MHEMHPELRELPINHSLKRIIDFPFHMFYVYIYKCALAVTSWVMTGTIPYTKCSNVTATSKTIPKNYLLNIIFRKSKTQ